MAKLIINTKGIIDNYNYIMGLNCIKNRELIVVTKLFYSSPDLINILKKQGIDKIADCNIENFAGQTGLKRMLLKTSLSDIREKKLSNCESILVTELKMLEAVSEMGLNNIEIYLGIETGDLREGIVPSDFYDFMKSALKIKGINIAGIYTNLGCLAGKLPDEETITQLLDAKETVKRKLGFEIKKISIGGTVFYDMIKSDSLPDEVNQIRMGEAIFFAYNMSYHKRIPELTPGNFILKGEIVEIKSKNTSIRGEIGFNAFGKIADKTEGAVRKRAILDFGELQTPLYGLTPCDPGVRIHSNTHNYTVVDITNTEKKYDIGDTIDFYCNYNSVAFAFLSGYVAKEFI